MRVHALKAVQEGDSGYIRRKTAQDDDGTGVRNRHKLQAKVYGPYPIIAAFTYTILIMRNGLIEEVSRDSESLAPPPNDSTEHTATVDRHDERARDVTPVNASSDPPPHDEPGSPDTPASERPEKYAFDRILLYEADSNRFPIR